MTGGFWIALSAVGCAGISAWLFRNKAAVEREVWAGRLKIRLGEDLNGPSYQMAASEVLGFVFAFAAMICVAVLLSYIGTPARP